MTCPTLHKRGNILNRVPVVMAIMDGIGVGTEDEGNAVFAAKTPCLDHLIDRGALFTKLIAHGKAVGMPSDNDMGNSEVGHNAFGAGQVFDQGAKLINSAIESGRLFQGSTWQKIVKQCTENKTSLHFIGLLSDGNVHSHIDQLLALIKQADREGIKEAYIHSLLDGRDVPKVSAHLYVQQLEDFLKPINQKPQRRYKIASGGGRMITTMDRYESDWSIVERGWQAHVLGRARFFSSASVAIETFRQEQPNIVDQELPPFVIQENGRQVAQIKDNDAVIVFNFRGDRMLELTQAFEDPDFIRFDRIHFPQVFFAGMMQYDGDTHRPRNFLVDPPQIECTISELLCEQGITQMACSETQKFGHVTYFWNGNRTGAFNEALEKYIEISSHAPPFEQKPEMRATEIADTVIQELMTDRYHFLRCNFANGDMVGHTGDFTATVKAVEAVDKAIARLVEEVVEKKQSILIVTADHGNADEMGERDKKTKALQKDEKNQIIPRTSHSLNPVPFYILLPQSLQNQFRLAPVLNPSLGNVAATLAMLLGFEPPKQYLPPLIEAL